MRKSHIITAMSETPSGGLGRGRGLLLALGATSVLLAYAHRDLLPRGRVNSFSATPPAAERIRSIYEMVYQELPVQWTAARMVKSGVFPAWTPWAEGGTPLLGKMQNGVFSPLRLDLYLLPERWMPAGFTLIPLLTALALAAAAFLAARAAGLSPPAAAAGAAAFVFSGTTVSGHSLFANNASAIGLPLWIVLAELHLSGRRGAALILAPWAAALPVFAGHFEVSLRVAAGGAAYLLLRGWAPPAKREAMSFDRLLPLALAAAAGGAFAAVQIVPGLEYMDLSYNMVWRSRPEYGWVYLTLQKHFALGDLPALILGWAGVLGGAWGLRRYARGSSPSSGLYFLAGGAAALAVGLGALGWVGLDVTGSHLFKINGSPDPRPHAALLLALAAWASCQDDLPRGLRALSVLTAIAALVQLKAPPLSTLLGSLPVVGLLNNTIYHPEYDLGRCLLAAWAAERLAASSRRPWAERAPQLFRAALLAAAILAAAASAPGLMNWTAGGLDTGVSRQAAGPAGGFMGPERRRSFGGRGRFAGAVRSGPGVAAVDVADSRNGAPPLPVRAELSRRADGTTAFLAELALSTSPAMHQLVAGVRYADGRETAVRGPQVEVLEPPGWTSWATGLLAVPLGLIHPAAAPAALAAAAGFMAHRQSVSGVATEDFPLRLPGLEAVRRDPDRFRIDSMQDNFLSADYANLYGIADIRNGGDNLDVLPMIYFLFLRRGLLNDPAGLDMGLRLTALAGVKYFVAPPETRTPTRLEEVYRGPEMAVFRNPGFSGKARFFESYTVLPAVDLKDWDAGRRLAFGEVPKLLSRPGFAPEKTLLIDEAPMAPPPPEGPATGREPAVRVTRDDPARVEIEVDTPRQGLVFLADNHFPGWSARVNGMPVGIIRAWLTFRAVAVPAGRSTVVFRYAPLRLRAAAALSIASILAWWVVYFLWRRRRSSRPPAPPAPAAPPMPARSGKGRKRAPEPAEAEPEGLEEAGAWTERLILLLTGPACVFWAAWALYWR